MDQLDNIMQFNIRLDHEHCSCISGGLKAKRRNKLSPGERTPMTYFGFLRSASLWVYLQVNCATHICFPPVSTDDDLKYTKHLSTKPLCKSSVAERPSRRFAYTAINRPCWLVTSLSLTTTHRDSLNLR